MKRLSILFAVMLTAILALATSACTTTTAADGSKTTTWTVTPDQLNGLTQIVTAIKTQQVKTVVVPTKPAAVAVIPAK